MLATTIQITNNPPHTPTPTTSWLAARATTTTSGGRSHGVEREPDSVSARITFYAQPNHAPTPTTHIGWRTHAGTRKQPNTPTNRPPCCIVPQENGLPRKEVIQPHLPVRLPCYDFVPIANPTFDHSPQQEPVGPWASGVTNFRDVTGGVYKARERIHRSVADLRLLATPPSWGRVADPNPN